MRICGEIRTETNENLIGIFSPFKQSLIHFHISEAAIEFVRNSKKVYCYMVEDKKSSNALLLFDCFSGKIFILDDGRNEEELRNEFLSFVFGKALVQEEIVDYSYS